MTTIYVTHCLWPSLIVSLGKCLEVELPVRRLVHLKAFGQYCQSALDKVCWVCTPAGRACGSNVSILQHSTPVSKAALFAPGGCSRPEGLPFITPCVCSQLPCVCGHHELARQRRQSPSSGFPHRQRRMHPVHHAHGPRRVASVAREQHLPLGASPAWPVWECGKSAFTAW